MTVKHLVVPLDGSDVARRAVPVAAWMADRCHGSLTLVSTPWHDDADAPRAYLEELAAGVSAVDVETRVVRNLAPADAIRVVAEEIPDGAIVMSTHGRGRLRWAVLGSVAEEVVCKSAVPVALVGRNCRAEPPVRDARLLVAVDTVDLERPVADAIDWARSFGLNVELTTAIHPLAHSAPEDEMAVMSGRVAAAGIPVRTCILRDSYVAGAIADHAAKERTPFIVMESHRRTGAARVALGSVTMAVVGIAPCPVVVPPRS
jgi:nucleotide-binding universal stress UspA family protein